MAIQSGTPIRSADMLLEHNPDGTHKGVKNLKHGPSSTRPTNPDVGDVWLNEDTQTIDACFTPGIWTRLPYVIGGLGHIEVLSQTATFSRDNTNSGVPYDFDFNFTFQSAYSNTPVVFAQVYYTSPTTIARSSLDNGRWMLINLDINGVTVSGQINVPGQGTFIIQCDILVIGN